LPTFLCDFVAAMGHLHTSSCDAPCTNDYSIKVAWMINDGTYNIFGALKHLLKHVGTPVFSDVLRLS
jgi:hypothetical protein